MKIWIIAFNLTTCGKELCRRGMGVKRLLPPPIMDQNEKFVMWLSVSGALSHPDSFMNKRVWDKLSIPLGVGKNFAVGNCTERVKTGAHTHYCIGTSDFGWTVKSSGALSHPGIDTS